MNTSRNLSGRYGKKRKWKVAVRWLLLILIVVLIISATVKHSPKGVTVEQPDHVQGCSNDTQCRAKLENFAAQTLVQEKIDALNVQEADLQKQLEQLRQEELSLQ